MCELNAKKAAGEELSDNENIIADSYGKDGEVDINAESLEFDIAALLGRVVSRTLLHCVTEHVRHLCLLKLYTVQKIIRINRVNF